MGPKRFYSRNFSLFIVKFKKLWFSAPLKFLPPIERVNQGEKWIWRHEIHDFIFKLNKILRFHSTAKTDAVESQILNI